MRDRLANGSNMSSLVMISIMAAFTQHLEEGMLASIHDYSSTF